MEKLFDEYSGLFFNKETDLLCVCSDDHFLYVSPAWSVLLGWSSEELLQMSIKGLIHPDDREATTIQKNSVLDGTNSIGFTNRYITKNREIKWLRWRGVLHPSNPGQFLAVATDVTDAKLKERSLRVSQDLAKIGNWHFHKQTAKFYWGEQIFEIYGVPHGTDLDYVKRNSFHDNYNWSIITKAFDACLYQGIISHHEIKLRTYQGESKWISCWWLPIKINDEIIGVEGIAQDITHRKQEELALKQAEERYEKVLNGINAGIFEQPDLSKPEIYWSPRIYKILGYDPLNTHPTFSFFESIIHPDDSEKMKLTMVELLELNTSRQFELRLLCADGKYKWVQSSVVAVRNEEGIPCRIVGSAIDIHQKKITETSLEEEKQKSIQASKLATLGEMAAGLAHEVNNPLTIIFGYIRVLEEELKAKDLNLEQVSKFLGLIKSAADRAAKIVHNLKDFARDGAQDPFEDHPVSEIMSFIMDLSKERFKKNDIRLEIDLNCDSILFCRKLEISQVIMNLLFNSFDAISELDQKWVKVQISKTQGKLDICVIDSGRGLVPEVAEKIFTPFFTTKKLGLGTGLGLSISQRIILNHGGEIFYDPSSLNTKFVVRLPLNYELT